MAFALQGRSIELEYHRNPGMVWYPRIIIHLRLHQTLVVAAQLICVLILDIKYKYLYSILPQNNTILPHLKIAENQNIHITPTVLIYSQQKEKNF